MRRVTVIWISEASGRCRSVSAPRRFFAAALALAAVAAAGAVFQASRAAHLQLVAARQERTLEELNARLADQQQHLAAEGERTRSLEAQARALSEALRDLRVTEEKIRGFLGLEDPNKKAPLPNTAGAKSHAGVEPSSFGGPREAVRLSEEVGRGFESLLVHLEERRQTARRIPSILPTASEEAWLSGTFGWRQDPIAAAGREFHNGIDIAGPWKSPILAPADGEVWKAGKDRLLGTYVILKHSPETKTVFGHLASAEVKAGEKVKRGQTIGLMGNSGRSTGTHLHYSVNWKGEYVNPLDFILDRPFHHLSL